MTIIIAILITLYICVGIMLYIFAKILNDFANSVGVAFGWPVGRPPIWHTILDFIITVLFWPILLICAQITNGTK